ncbi:hypothetical protein D4R42_03055 [bacterium]|nr:MAG: hypothetical protein D4R42_03055 [bacterium]
MYRISKKEKNLFLIAAIFVGFALLYRLVLLPGIGKSRTLNHQIQLKKQMIENSLRLLNQKEDIQRKSQKFANYAKENLSEEEEIAAFLKEIENIAKNSSVQLIDIKPYSAERKDFYIEYRIEIETESDMNQLITLIYNLQNSESLLRVIKFRISPKADNISIVKGYLTITKVFVSD